MFNMYCQFEPVVQPGHEELVHHIIVYKCPMDRKYINLTYGCDDPKYSYLHLCPVVYLAWAVGGEVCYFLSGNLEQVIKVCTYFQK